MKRARSPSPPSNGTKRQERARAYPENTLDLVKGIARTAGAVIRENHGIGRTNSKAKRIEKKAAADLVTEVDIAVEKLVTDSLLKLFPDHAILGEESSGDASHLTAKPTWIIDPIDGTTNFVHGNPHCAVSIGFCLDFEPLLGVVYNPILDELYAAEAGHGAYLETSHGKAKRVLDRRSNSADVALADALVGSGFLVSEVGKLRHPEKLSERKRKWLENLKKNIFANHAAVLPLCRDLRRSGSAACDMCAVASGTLDAYWEFGVREWDIAAGVVICKEAGVSVTDLDGSTALDRSLGQRKIMACCSEALSRELGAHLHHDGFLPFVHDEQG